MFRDRHHAGEVLAERLARYSDDPDVIVLGLPRGGVPVACEIAKRIHAPLDVFVVRKLGVPGYDELAIGAIASGGVRVLNEEVVAGLWNATDIIASVTEREQAELERREKLYRDDRPSPDLTGRTIILVDDGLATGATMRAAIAALRSRGVARIVVAAPVGAPATCHALEREVDEIICAVTPDSFHAIGQFYEDFSQTSDEEVRRLLAGSIASS